VKGVAFHGCCLLIVEAWALRHGCQKNTYGAEQPFGTIVDSHAPGEAPQPLTLNHSASDPGCSAVGVHSFEGRRQLPAARGIREAKNEFCDRHRMASELAQFGMRI
jgi:hypothetical protein